MLSVIIAGVCLRAAYFDAKSGELVLDNRAIAKNYLTGWFAVDLVHASPLSLLHLSCLLSHALSSSFVFIFVY
jgi:hypothetical protein